MWKIFHFISLLNMCTHSYNVYAHWAENDIRINVPIKMQNGKICSAESSEVNSILIWEKTNKTDNRFLKAFFQQNSTLVWQSRWKLRTLEISYLHFPTWKCSKKARCHCHLCKLFFNFKVSKRNSMTQSH